MRAKIFCALIAVICLNFVDILNDNMIFPKGNITRLENIQRCNGGSDIVSRSNHLISITWRGISSVNTCDISCSSLGFLPSLFGTSISYIRCFNKYVGFVGSFTLFGDAYYSFIGKNLSNSILQFGLGIIWSYNGNLDNNDYGDIFRVTSFKQIYWGGKLTIEGMWGSFVNDGYSINGVDLSLGFYCKRFGCNIGIIPLYLISKGGFIFELKIAGIDIGYFLCRGKSFEDTIVCFFNNTGISVGKSWSI